MKEIKQVRRTVPIEHKGKEGLICTQDGKIIYDDSWLHPEDAFNFTKKSLDLYIDLSKANIGPRGKLNTAKLVKKPVMVRGKNGKVFTRMQWVKPYEEESSDSGISQEQEKPKNVGKISQEDLKPEIKHNDVSEIREIPEMDTLEMAKKKIDENTQEGFIEYTINKMSREEKYDLIEKYDITWKRNEHSNIDHMNAIKELKKFMKANPHILGADHLPKQSTVPKTPDGTDVVNEFYDKIKKDLGTLYAIMKEVGIGNGVDPRKEKGLEGQIDHMNMISAFKKYLVDNPYLMEDPRWNIKGKIKVPKQKKKQTKAQKGGNNIEGIMATLTEEEKYGYIKMFGISDKDLTMVDPQTRMDLMSQLKVKLIMNPSVLNQNPFTEDTSKEEKQRKEALSEKESIKEKVNDFFNKLLKPTKEMLIEEYSHLDCMKNRKRNEHSRIDYMNGLSTLKGYFMEHPELLENHKADLEDDELAQLKITNKQMEKVIRQVAGIKGSFDVKQVEKDENGRNIEWSFLGDSFARIERDSYGNWVLNIEYYGETFDDYESQTFELSEIQDFVQGLTSRGVPKKKDIPLHEQSIGAILDALNKDFEKNYTEQVGDKLKPWIYDQWIGKGQDMHPSFIVKDTGLQASTLEKVLSKFGIDISYGEIVYNNNWKNAMYSHLIEPSKAKNAADYFVRTPMGENDVYVLHESAKQWTPQEKAEARMELIEHAMRIEEDLSDEDVRNRFNSLVHHTKKTLDFVPFDLFSHIIASGTTFSYPKEVETYAIDNKGNIKKVMEEYTWGRYSGSRNSIELSYLYLKDKSVYKDNPLGHTPSHPDERIQMHSYAHALSHEFGHAIDHFLSSGSEKSSFLDWETKIGEKYSGKLHSMVNPVKASYSQAVNSSNPSKQIGMATDGKGNLLYMYHKDNWMWDYEGRIYDKRYSKFDTEMVKKDSSGNYYDNEFGAASQQGVEHWSENVARYACAHLAYKTGEGDLVGDMAEWADLMSDAYVGQGYSTSDSITIRNEDPELAYGHEYKTLKNQHPELFKALSDILDRSDFIDVPGTPYSKQVESSEGEFVRKSNGPDLILKS